MRILSILALAVCANAQTPAAMGPTAVYQGSDLYFTMVVNDLKSHMVMNSLVVTGGSTIDPICSNVAVGCWKNASGKSYLWVPAAGYAVQKILIRVTGNNVLGPQTATIVTDNKGTLTYEYTVLPLPNRRPSSIADRWEERMVTLGRKWCPKSGDVMLFGTESQVWYYDGARVYFQIADYTGDKSFNECGLEIARQYRDNVISRNGGLQGWRVFPYGLMMAYQRTGDDSFKQAVLLMAKNSAFVTSGGSNDASLIRETAYLIELWIAAEKLGAPRHPMLSRAVSFLLGHFDMLFRARTGYTIHQVFMDGLAGDAFLAYYDQTGDKRALAAVRSMLDWIIEKGWDAGRCKLIYNPDPPGPTCTDGCQAYNSVTINMVAPSFSGYAARTGDTKYRDFAERLFSHSLDEDISYSGKIFSQTFRTSIQMVKELYGF